MKICVLSLYHGGKFKKDTKYGRQTIVDYCKKHNYDFIEDDSLVKEHDREIQWTKILLIQKYLQFKIDEKDTYYDYLVWLDADIIILNPEKTIENFIERLMCRKDIMYSKDPYGWINNGVIFIKNTTQVLDFFRESWNHTNEVCREQGAMDILYRMNWNNCRHYIQVTDDPKEYNPVWFMYEYGIFLMHFPGSGEPSRSSNSLLKMLDMFSPLKLKGDDEHILDTEDSYQERLKWLREDAEIDLKHKRQLCIQQGWKYFPIDLE